ncbi:hypothetical protein F2Q69_00046241 [Brassica cretica]|uniref:Uncharacterized protein n=1 Tax=Brassica cretica TaxID=69181 RepID=A0A8S9PL84_BRACR|nr:hypothetical protein F2Q69_00046241 [Brassica cretica]
MVRTKKMAKHDIAVTLWTHAGGESSRPHLTDEGSEQTPSRNNLLSSTLFPEITEELSQRSGEGKEQSEDNSEPVEKIQEEAQIDGTVSLASSSGEISEKQGRKNRIMKRLGLGTSKRSKTSKSGTSRQSSLDQPNVSLGSQVVTQNTSLSSRVRSRKASEKGNVVEVSPATKRIDQFLRRNIIDERLVDMTEKYQWGYVEIIENGSMGTTISSLGNYVEQFTIEFYVGLPVTKVKADAEEVEVQVRDHVYQFSPTMINDILNLKSLNEDEVDEETALDAISKSELAEFLTKGTR